MAIKIIIIVTNDIYYSMNVITIPIYYTGIAVLGTYHKRYK